MVSLTDLEKAEERVQQLQKETGLLQKIFLSSGDGGKVKKNTQNYSILIILGTS